MHQGAYTRGTFEAREDLSGCPPPEKLDLLERGWKPSSESVFGHGEKQLKSDKCPIHEVFDSKKA
jgi:hypothetical protein